MSIMLDNMLFINNLMSHTDEIRLKLGNQQHAFQERLEPLLTELVNQWC